MILSNLSKESNVEYKAIRAYTSNSSLTTTSGNITLVGTGGTSSTASTMGVSIYSGSTISTATGAIAITGTTTSTGANAYGVKLQLNSAVSASGNGTIAITGTGSATATGSASEGIALFDNADVTSAGSGSITLTGTGGTGSHGIITGSTANDMTIGGGSSTGALNLIANSISMDTSNTTIQTTGTATLRQNTNGTAIDLGSSSGVGATLNLSDAELDRITAGTVQIGNASSGAITVSAALTHLNTNALTLTAGTGQNINLNANFTTAGGAVTFSNAVVVGSTATVDTTNAGGTVAGAAILFSGTTTLGADLTIKSGGATTVLAGKIDGAHALTLNNSNLSSAFQSAVGSITPLTTVTSSPGRLALSNVTTTGAQNYNSATTNADATFVTSNNPITMGFLAANDVVTISTGSGDVTIGGVNGNNRAFTVNSTGATVFTATVGSFRPFSTVTTDAGGTTTFIGNVITTGAQSYGDNVIIGGTSTMSTTGSAVTFGGTTTLNAGLTVSTGAGNITFTGAVNGGQALVANSTGATLFSTTVGATTPLASLTTNAGGTTTLTGNVTTTGAQSYGEAVTLAATSTLATTNANISFGNTISGSSFGLTLGAGTGAVSLGGAVSLSALTSTSASINALPALTIGAGGLSLTTTTGGFTQSGALTVTGAATLAAGAANNITLGSANDFSTLAITSGNNVAVTDSNALILGASTVSGTLGVTTSGAITQSGALTVTGVMTLTPGAANDVTLTNTSNAFGTVTVPSAASVSLLDNGGFNLGAISTSTLLTVESTGAITQSGILAGNGGLTKLGTGTMTLSLSNGYLGATTLNAGSTLVTGSITGTGAVAVNSAATLGGTGSLAGTVTVGTGGIITGGTDGTVGTLTVGSLVFNGGTYKADLVGTAADKISTAGSINLNGGTAGIFTLNNLASGVSAGSVFTFLENTSGSAIAGAPLTGATAGGTVTVSSQTARYAYLGGLGGNDFTLTLDGAATMTGTAGADNFEVRRVTSGGADLIQVLRGGIIVDSRATAGYAGSALTLNGGDGNDNLFINYSASGGIYDFDINYDGGNQTSAPGDSITIGGATVGTVTHNFIDDHSGSIVVNNGTARTINYIGIEPITDNLSATNRVFTFTGGAETIALTDAGGGLNMIDSTLGESVTFTSPTTSLIVNGGTGNDTINLTSLNASFAAALTINGDAGTNSVSIAAGLPTFASITVNAEAITANTLTTTGAQLYNGPVTLGANTTLTTTNSNVGFTSTVNGASSLAISTGSGSITFSGVVGSTTALTSLATTSTGIATLTGNVTTTGASGVVLNSPVTLAATTTVATGTGPITFSSTLDGAFALTLSNTGLTTFTGNVGASSALTSLASTSATLAALPEITAATVNITTTAGSVFLDKITATSGLTIHSFGTIEESGAGDITEDIITPTATLVAGTGIGTSGAGLQLELAVTNLSATTATGGVDVINTGALSITGGGVTGASGDYNIQTVSGNLTLAGAITFAGTSNVTLAPGGASSDLDTGAGITAGSGLITLTAANDVTIGAGNVSTSGNVFITADNDSDTFGAVAHAGGIVSASLVNVSAGETITLKTNASFLTATAHDSDIAITETNGLALNLVDAGAGDIAITLLAGALTDNNAGAVNIHTSGAGAGATLIAPGGIADIETDVESLTASSTNTAIIIHEADGLLVNTINAGTGDVTLTATLGALADNNGALTNITGGALTLSAPDGIDLDTAATTLAATTTNSDIIFRELNSIALNLINAGTGDVTLTAGGAITDANGAANNITADALTLIGTTGITGIETDVATLDASTTNADISIAENNALTVGLIDAGTGNVTLSASGLLTDGNAGAINFAATNLTLNITGGFTSIETDVDSFSATSTNAAIGIIESDDVAIGLINAGSGNVNLASVTGALTDGNGAANNITGSVLTLTAATGLDLDITATLLHASVTGTGAINLSDLAGGLDVLDATTNDGAITLGAIGGNLTLTGVSAGNGGMLNLSTTTSGNIFLDDATTTGNAIITAIGSISESGAGDADVDLSAGTATFTAGTGIGIGAGGAIETALGTLTAATTTTGGITLDNIGELTIGNATVITSGNITITSVTDDTGFPTILPGSITVTGHITTPGNVTITAPEFDDAAPPFTNELTIAAGATINGAAVTLESGDDLTIAAGATVTSTGLMTLYAGLGDLDDQGDLHIFGTINPGAGLSMTAFGHIGVGTIYAPGQTISITSLGGYIYDQNDTATPTAVTVMNITAATLNLNAALSIGALGNTIETTVSNFSANGGAGGIYIYNTGALTLGTITSGGTGAGEDIEITTIGAMTVTGSVTQTGGQDITLFSTATSAPGTASSLTVNGTLATSGGTGNITLNAANQVSLGASAIITLAGAADLTLNAGWPNAGFSNPNADITISSPLNLVDANLTLTATRNVTLNGANADITTTGTFTVDADRDGSANGTGGSFIQDTLGSIVHASTVDITAADIALSGIIDAGASDISIHTSRIGSPILLNNAGVGLSISLADMLALRTTAGDITIGDASNTGITSIAGIGSFGLGLTDSNITIYGGTIDFNGNISLADNRTLTLNSGDLITASGPGIIDVTIGGTTGTLLINAENNVTLSTLIHNLGASTIISGGSLTLNNNNAALTISGAVLAEAISLTTGTATLTISDTLTASFSNTGHITLIADGLALNDDITGGGNLLIKGATTATTIGLGDTATGTLSLGVAELAHLLGGFTAINLGYTGQTGAVDIVTPVGNEVIFRDPVTINSSTTLGTIQIEDGPLTATNLGSFTLTSKTLTFSGAAPGIATESGIIDIHASTLLAGPTTLTTAIGGGSGNITLDGTIDGAQSLILDGGATGIVFIKGQSTAAPNGTSIGGTTALASLDVTGGTIRLYPNIFTTGPQTYTADDIRIRSARHITYGDGTGDITFNGPVTLNLLSSYGTTNSNITFNGGIFTETTDKGALTIASGTGDVAFNGDIGTNTHPLKSLEVLNSGSLTTAAAHALYVADLLKIASDEIDFNGPANSVHVTGTLSLLPSSNNVGVIVGGAESGTANRLSLSDDDLAAFADGTTSILIGSRAGSPDMVIATTLTFHDPVTFTTPLPRSGITNTRILVNDDLHGDTANGGFIFRGAGTVFNADVFTAGGAIDIQNGIIDAALVTLDTTAGNGNITFSGTLKPSTGGENLTVLAGSGTIRATGILGRDFLTNTTLGDVTFTTSGDTRLEQGFTSESLTVDGTGPIFLKGNFTTHQTGGQDYHGPVQLLGTTSLFSTDAFGPIHFYSTIDSDLTKPTKFFNLSLTNRVASDILTVALFDSAIGATGRLGNIKITTKGDAILSGDVRAKSLAITASDLTVQGVNTTLAQSYLGTSNFIGAITASKLTISTLSGLGITNAAPWNITGLTSLSSKFGDIAITGATNHFGDLILKAPSASLTENGNITLRQAVVIPGTLNLVTDAGNITQTTGSAVAHRFTASASGSITIDHLGTTFDEIGAVTAGGPITMVLGGAKYTKLDGTITAATGDIILAKAAASHTSFSSSALAHLIATTGRWEVYTTFASSLSQGYNLFTQLLPADTEIGITYPTAPTSLNNVLLYIHATQP